MGIDLPPDHRRSNIHPYVVDDIKDALSVPLYQWSAAVLKLPYPTLSKWATEIHKLRWFYDELIQDAFYQFCKARREKERCDPFVHLANRIIQLGRGRLSGVGPTYPIDSFCFANNVDRVIKPNPQHGSMASERRPDILGLCEDVAQNLYQPLGSVEWWNCLVVGELKFVSELDEMLIRERALRGMDIRADEKVRHAGFSCASALLMFL